MNEVVRMVPRQLSPVGSLDINLGGTVHRIMGGPYDAKPPARFGVKLDPLNKAPCNVYLPIKDFGVTTPEAMRQALREALVLLRDGKELYVGCMGGYGRTGMFLACLAKVAGYSAPVAYVRSNYCLKAVETRQQEEFVRSLPVSDLQQWVNGGRDPRKPSRKLPPRDARGRFMKVPPVRDTWFRRVLRFFELCS